MESVFPESGTGAEATPAPEQTTDDLVREVLAEQQQHRAEVAALREELAQAKSGAVTAQASSTAQSAEELAQERQKEISNHSHYCPGCGRLYDYLRECLGSASAPHPPIEVVSTDELKGDDKSAHTAAPNTDALG